MARKDPAEVPIREFFGKYANDVFAAYRGQNLKLPPVNYFDFTVNAAGEHELPPRIATTELCYEVERLWPIRLLRGASAENDAESYKRLLYLFLIELGVTPPKGVLNPFRWKEGRPRRANTEKICAVWRGWGQPPLERHVVDRLAKMFYSDEFSKALSNGMLRKNLRDRVRSAIRRNYPEASATKPQRVS